MGNQTARRLTEGLLGGPPPQIMQHREFSRDARSEGPVPGSISSIWSYEGIYDTPLYQHILDRSSSVWFNGNNRKEERAESPNSDPEEPEAMTTSRYCLCGCNEITNSRFAPGHDARYKGQLQKAVRFGTQSERNDAIMVARALGWSKFLYTAKTRTFGVEIECVSPLPAGTVAQRLREAGIDVQAEHYNHAVRDSWKITTDSSIQANGNWGIEVVSPVLNSKTGKAQLKVVTRVLREAGCKVNKSCGFHVHFAAHDLTADEIRNIVRSYRSQQREIDERMPVSRKSTSGNTYCLPIDLGYMRCIDRNSTLANIADDLSRYHVVNLKSYPKYGTVEFRQHQGTLNALKMISWIEFGLGMVAEAKTQTRAARPDAVAA